MPFLRTLICSSALIGAASLGFAAESPFAGTWKLNPAKSRLAGETVKFAVAGDGMRMTAFGETYEFKPDGSASKTSFGSAAWKKVDDQTWQETDMVNGKLDTTSTWTLSKDDKTLTEHTTGDKPAGGQVDDTAKFVRVAGTNGLAGTWKDREFKGSAPSLMVISDRENGLVFDEPDFELKATGDFDGKPGTVAGPTIPAGASFTLAKVNAHSFKMTRTQNGKPFDLATWKVSSDGKVMTAVRHTMGTTDPPFIEVFEKQ